MITTELTDKPQIAIGIDSFEFIELSIRDYSSDFGTVHKERLAAFEWRTPDSYSRQFSSF
jgi:hypothetical protein